MFILPILILILGGINLLRMLKIKIVTVFVVLLFISIGSCFPFYSARRSRMLYRRYGYGNPPIKVVRSESFLLAEARVSEDDRRGVVGSDINPQLIVAEVPVVWATRYRPAAERDNEDYDYFLNEPVGGDLDDEDSRDCCRLLFSFEYVRRILRPLF